jgi:DNA-directed RNA polymerase subunit F
MPKENKSSIAEYEKRVNKVYLMLINNNSRYEIIKHAKKEWDVQERQVDNYIKEANDIIKETAKQSQEEWLEDTKNKLRYLYKIAMQDGNIIECRRLIETANKVLGYEKLSIDNNITLNNFPEMAEKIRKVLNEQ